MIQSPVHTFHIPVMGLGFTIDTPVKVARFGITSVVSIIEDNLVEQMRKTYCEKESIPYYEITAEEVDYRARRITSYLNLLDSIVAKQIFKIKTEAFEEGNDIIKYFELLPESSSVKQLYEEMKHAGEELKINLQNKLR